jgi:hypothetical protein
MKRLTIVLAAAALAAITFGASAGDEKAKPSCCNKGAAAKQMKSMECDHGKAASAGDAKTGAMCDGASKKDVAYTGRLVGEKGAPMFQAEGRADALAICPETKDLAGLETAAKDGALEVKGVLCKGKDGKEMLMVTSFKKAGGKAA